MTPTATVFAVTADAGGAWEADCVYSIWTTRAAAEREIERLRSADVSAGCYSGEFHIAEVPLNWSSDSWIEHGGFACTYAPFQAQR